MHSNNKEEELISRKVCSENIRWLYPLEIMESKLATQNKVNHEAINPTPNKDQTLFIGGTLWKLPI